MSVIEFPTEERRAQVVLDRICDDLEREAAKASERYRERKATHFHSELARVRNRELATRLWTHRCHTWEFGHAGAIVRLDRDHHDCCLHCGRPRDPSQPPPSAA